MSTTRKDVRPAIKTALEASSALSGIPVIIDDGKTATFSSIEQKTRAAPGVVIAIPLMIGSTKVGQAATRNAEFAIVQVDIRSNPDLNTTKDVDDCIDAIKKAVLSAVTLDARTGEQPDEILRADAGMVSYGINFLIPLTQP